MENGDHLSLEQVQAFLNRRKRGSWIQSAESEKERYAWTQRTCCGAQSYSSLQRSGKGLMKRYIGKVIAGLEPVAQVMPRLIGQYSESGSVKNPAGPRAAIHRPLHAGRHRGCWRTAQVDEAQPKR